MKATDRVGSVTPNLSPVEVKLEDLNSHVRHFIEVGLNHEATARERDELKKAVAESAVLERAGLNATIAAQVIKDRDALRRAILDHESRLEGWLLGGSPDYLTGVRDSLHDLREKTKPFMGVVPS